MAGPELVNPARCGLLPCPPSLLLLLIASTDDPTGACGSSESEASRSAGEQVAASLDGADDYKLAASVPFTLPSPFKPSFFFF
jgi:hypothetical protein